MKCSSVVEVSSALLNGGTRERIAGLEVATKKAADRKEQVKLRGWGEPVRFPGEDVDLVRDFAGHK